MGVLDARTCLICGNLHGREFKSRRKIFGHVNCRCTLLSVIGDEQVETGVEKFERFELYQSGTKLNNFVKSSVSTLNQQESYFVKSLSDLFEPFASGGRAKGYFFITEKIFDYTPAGKLSGQSSDYSCVAGAARMILRDNGIDLPEAYLRAELKTTKEGTPLSHVAGVLTEEIGNKYVFRGKMKFDDLKSALEKGSAIVNVRAGGLVHSVVIDKIEDGKVNLRDPLPVGIGKAYAVTEETFTRYWQISEKKYGIGVIMGNDD
jgi:hypothetical protein